MATLKQEREQAKKSLMIPLIFVGILWVIKLVELSFGVSFSDWGIFPRRWSGLVGIVTTPFIHGGDRGEVLGNFAHLFSNSLPLIVLGFVVFNAYQKIAWKLIAFIWLVGGLWVWAGARPSYHIGASGLVYGLAFFVFFSGVFRKDIRSIALSCLVVFLYGGMIWGLLPIQEGVSWEGHLAGALAGICGAFYFRKAYPKKPHYFWMDDDDDDEGEIVEDPYWVKSSPITDVTTSTDAALDRIDQWEVKYHIVPKKKKEEE